MKETVKGRVEYIDIFRGFGIVLMIMGHIYFGDKFDFYIHAFHMPMFFFVTGFFFRSKEIEIAEFIKKKFMTLLIPYLSFSVMHCIFYLILNKTFHISLLYHVMLINTDGMPIAGALWFLTALFFVDILYFVLDRKFKDNMKVFTLIIVFFAAAGTAVPMLMNIRLPWAIDISFVSLGFCHIGRLISQNRSNKIIAYMLNMNIFYTIAVIAVFSITVFVNGYVNMRKGEYSIVPLFWLNAIGLIIGWLNLARIIDSSLSNAPVVDKVIGEMKFIGRNSIIYLCLNQVTILVIQKICKHLPLSQIPWLVISFVSLIITIAVLHLFTILFNRTKLKLMLGKK